MIETYYSVLKAFQNGENGKELLLKALEAQIDDPFLAIKLTPPIILLLPYLEGALHQRLNAYLHLLHERMDKESIPDSLKTRAKLARMLVGSPSEEIKIDLFDFFHPSLGPDLFPLVFLQNDPQLKDEWRSKLFSCWNAKEEFFIGPAFYSMHGAPSLQEEWMRSLPAPKEIKPNKDPRFTVFPSLSFFKDTSHCLPSYWRGFHLVRGYFSGHTFSVQGRGEASVSYNDSIDVAFTYPKGCSDPSIGFYIDRAPGIDFQVNGEKALSFGRGDVISFKAKNFQVDITFTLTQGAARVSGQIIPSCRPAKEEDGSDWGVFLRPVVISEDSIFVMSIKVSA